MIGSILRFPVSNFILQSQVKVCTYAKGLKYAVYALSFLIFGATMILGIFGHQFENQVQQFKYGLDYAQIQG